MTQYDLGSLLAPISEESPAGENLEYDAQLLELERVATPKAERAIGDSVKAAEEPAWEQVETLAKGILERSKDLRAAIHLTTAWLQSRGLPGWVAGLALVRGLLENFWDGVYPQLDAEDDNDPIARVNCVTTLADPLGVLGYFRAATFVRSPRLGQFSLRSLRIANGTLKMSASSEQSGEAPTLTEVEACCMDCPEQDLLDAFTATGAALEHATAIDRIFNDKVGTAGPDFKPLLVDHRELLKFLETQVARRMPEQADAAVTDDGGTAPAGTGGTNASSARIDGPQDVMRRLDELCEYYAKREPSSPVPLLLRRAQRLVGAGFVDLMKDLAPGGLSELKLIAGSVDEG